MEDWRYRSTDLKPWHWMEVCDLFYAPAAFSLTKEWYPLYKRLDRPHSRSGRCVDEKVICFFQQSKEVRTESSI
jgi:hypothetical protein